MNWIQRIFGKKRSKIDIFQCQQYYRGQSSYSHLVDNDNITITSVSLIRVKEGGIRGQLVNEYVIAVSYDYLVSKKNKG